MGVIFPVQEYLHIQKSWKKICLKTDFPEHSTDDLKLSMMINFLHFVDCW